MVFCGTETHICHSHLCGSILNMTSVIYYIILKVSNRQLDNSPDLMFCALWLLSLRCLRLRSLRVKKDECILLADMQYSQPHTTLYRAVVLLICGDNMLRKVESMMMMLSSVSLASFSPPSSGGLTMLLYSSLTDTFNNNFGTNCGPACPYIYNVIQSLSIGYRTTWGWCRIYLYRYFLTHSLILVWLCYFGILDHNILPDLIDLLFYLVPYNRRKDVFDLTSNVSVNWQSDFLALGF